MTSTACELWLCRYLDCVQGQLIDRALIPVLAEGEAGLDVSTINYHLSAAKHSVLEGETRIAIFIGAEDKVRGSDTAFSRIFVDLFYKLVEISAILESRGQVSGDFVVGSAGRHVLCNLAALALG